MKCYTKNIKMIHDSFDYPNKELIVIPSYNKSNKNNGFSRYVFLDGSFVERVFVDGKINGLVSWYHRSKCDDIRLFCVDGNIEGEHIDYKTYVNG